MSISIEMSIAEAREFWTSYVRKHNYGKPTSYDYLCMKNDEPILKQ